MSRDLAAQLAADRAASPCHQDGLAFQMLEDFLHIHLDGFPAQQVLHRHRLHPAKGNLAVCQLVDARQRLQLTARLLADVQQIPSGLGRSGGNGQQDLLHPIFLHCLEDIVPSSHHRNPFQQLAPFLRIIVNEAHRPGVGMAGIQQLPQHDLSCVSRSDDHGVPGLAAILLSPAPLQGDVPIAKAHSCHQNHLDDRAEHIVGGRHPPLQSRDPNHMKGSGQHRSRQNPIQFIEAGELPNTSIKMQTGKYKQCKQSIHRRKVNKGVQVFPGNLGEPQVEAQPQPHKVGEVHRDYVINHQVKRHNLLVHPSPPEFSAVFTCTGLFLTLISLTHTPSSSLNSLLLLPMTGVPSSPAASAPCPHFPSTPRSRSLPDSGAYPHPAPGPRSGNTPEAAEG